VYELPAESVTELTVAVVSFHPTTTTLRFPPVCGCGNETVTVD
jgi:hypothetical protein